VIDFSLFNKNAEKSLSGYRKSVRVRISRGCRLSKWECAVITGRFRGRYSREFPKRSAG